MFEIIIIIIIGNWTAGTVQLKNAMTGAVFSEAVYNWAANSGILVHPVAFKV